MTKLYTLLGLLLAFSLNSFAQITITTEDWGTCPGAWTITQPTLYACESVSPSPASGGNYIKLIGDADFLNNVVASTTFSTEGYENIKIGRAHV